MSNMDILTETVYKVIELRPDFKRLGFVVKLENQIFLVKYVEAKSPANTAGLREGDIIFEVNGLNVTNFTFEDLIEIMSKSKNVLVLGVKTNFV